MRRAAGHVSPALPKAINKATRRSADRMPPLHQVPASHRAMQSCYIKSLNGVLVVHAEYAGVLYIFNVKLKNREN